MVRTALTFGLVAFIAAPVLAQGRGRNSQGIPPGQMPPAGQCRVWYEGRPPGQQPRATNCDEAERVASRNRNARVIYGSDVRYGRNDDRYGRNDDRYGRNDGWYGDDDNRDRDGRAIPRPEDIRNRYPNRSGAAVGAAFDQGYRDGVTKAREDLRDNDRYDPARHGWYKDADRGYNSRYGTRDAYRQSYRSGFVQGYDEEYRPNNNTNTRRSGIQLPWPF